MIFQVTDPRNLPIFEYALALHINPQNFDEKFSKSKSTVQTYGGYVEWIWPDELDSVSATMSTGAFLGPESGLISGGDGAGALINGATSRAGVEGRHSTIAWERQEDFLDLFRNNGVIRDGMGLPILHGNVMCMYDRGIYTGYFTTLEVKETDEKVYSFELSWEFKVLATVYKFPGSINTSATGDFKFLNQAAAASDRLAAETRTAASALVMNSPNGPNSVQDISQSNRSGGRGQ